MKDYVSGYQRKKRFVLWSTLLCAFVLALGVNVFLWESDIGGELRADISQWLQSSSSDLIAQQDDNGTINIHTQQPIADMRSMNITIAYDPDTLTHIDVASDTFDIDILSQQWGILQMLVISTPARSLDARDVMFALTPHKKQALPASLTLLETSFTDTQGVVYMLSTPSVIF